MNGGYSFECRNILPVRLQCLPSGDTNNFPAPTETIAKDVGSTVFSQYFGKIEKAVDGFCDVTTAGKECLEEFLTLGEL